MSSLEPPRFRLVPALVRPRVTQLGIGAGILAFGAFVLGVARWADEAGAAATRFRIVAQAGLGVGALADAAGATGLGGYPLDAVLAFPLTWLHGSWPAVTATLWVLAAGFAAAWLVGSWWADEAAALVGGLLWELVVSPALAEGDTATLAALAALPVAWGLALRSLRGGAGTLAGAAAAAGFVAAVAPAEVPTLVVLLAITAGVGAREVGARVVFPRLAAIGVGATLLALPALPLRAADAVGFAALSIPIVLLAGMAVVTLRRAAPRALLPILAVVAGIGPVPAEAAAALGLVLLACGAVPRLAQLAEAELERREAALAKT